MGPKARSGGRVYPSLEGVLVVLPVASGLGASAALWVDYVRTSPVFCAEGGGCEAVKQTHFASLWGLPTPLLGLVGFGLLAVLGVLRGSRMRALHCAAALLGGAVGVLLIATQIAIGQYCVYCLIADVAACVAAGVAVWRSAWGWDLPGGPGVRRIVAASLAAVPGAVISLGLMAKGHLPSLIVEEIRRAPKGKATVVEFVDFECPFCRDEYGDLAPLLEASKDKVHVVRKLVPLTRIHPHAMEAARAALCAEMLGKGDAMAEALFRAPIEELTSSGCERIAKELGLDPAQYGSCLADPKTAERIAVDRHDFDRAAAKGDGLPLLWIGDQKIMGLKGAETLRRALDDAIAKAGS
jgi:protein-disulfide isomerase